MYTVLIIFLLLLLLLLPTIETTYIYTIFTQSCFFPFSSTALANVDVLVSCVTWKLNVLVSRFIWIQRGYTTTIYKYNEVHSQSYDFTLCAPLDSEFERIHCYIVLDSIHFFVIFVSTTKHKIQLCFSNKCETKLNNLKHLRKLLKEAIVLIAIL